MKRNIQIIMLAVLASLLVWLIIWIRKVENRKKLMTSIKNIVFGIIVPNPVFRNDPAGSGHFGAKRGTRDHQGLDILVSKGEVIYSPICGKVSRAYPYLKDGSVDKDWTGIKIEGEHEFEGITIKMFYVAPNEDLIGFSVCPNDPIGVAQAISQRYPGQGMKDHVHVEVYLNGSLVDPQPYFKVLAA